MFAARFFKPDNEPARAERARLREFSANGALALAAFGLVVAIEKLLVLPYLGRRLDEAAFGALLLARNTALVVGGSLSAGLHNLLLRHNRAWDDNEKAAAARTAALLGGLLTLLPLVVVAVVGVVGGGAGGEWWRNHRLAVLSFGVWSVAGTVGYLWQTYWRMTFRLRTFYALQAITGCTLLAVIPGYVLGSEAGVYWGWAASGLLALLVTQLVAARDVTWRNAPWWRADEARRMWRQMWVFVWGVVGQTLLQNTDRFVIGWLLGAAAVGGYFKVTSTAYMILVPVEPLAGLLLSMAAQERGGASIREQLRDLHRLIALIVLGALGGGALLGPSLTDLLYGAGTFAAGRRLYWIVLGGCLCAIVSVLLRGLLIVYVPARRIVLHDTISIAALIVSSLALTRAYGLVGAAWAVALTLALRAALSEAVIRLTIRHQHCDR